MLEHLMFRLLDCLMFSGTVMFFGIGMGPSGAEKTQYGDIANLSNFATSEGEKDILSSDQFWQAILSGDPGQISKVLGPQMSAINKQGQQQKKTGAEFGNRGGGTNAAMQMTDTNTRTSIDSMIAELTGKAAGALGGAGSGLLSTGLSGHIAGFDAATTMQKQNEAKWGDIFKGITSVASSLLPGGGVAKAATSAFPGMSAGQISGSYGGPTSAETQPIDTSSWDQQL